MLYAGFTRAANAALGAARAALGGTGCALAAACGKVER